MYEIIEMGAMRNSPRLCREITQKRNNDDTNETKKKIGGDAIKQKFNNIRPFCWLGGGPTPGAPGAYCLLGGRDSFSMATLDDRGTLTYKLSKAT